MNKMLDIINNKQFRLSFLFIALLELLSLSGYLMPAINELVFILICVAFLVISLKDLTPALWIVIVELIIGSKGYLFYLDIAGAQLSIRMALWIILMAVWFWSEIQNYWVNRKLSWPFSYYRYYWLALAFFITYGLLIGIVKHNDPSNIFLDFNNWLYLLMVLPAYRLLNQGNYKKYWPLLAAGFSWLVVKTIALLFTFSHNILLTNTEIYRWVRTTGIAEVTEMSSGFYRIFFQSHVYIILAFLGVLFVINKLIKEKEKIGSWLIVLSILSSIIIITLSRSFWVGLVVGIVVYWILSLCYYKLNVKQLIISNLSWLGSLVIGVIILFTLVRFPYPAPLLDVSLTGLFAERMNVTDEAAASSRWSLLPELWGGITVDPLLGQGFGATITYESDDPRVRESSADGMYTTYAFEWGWLDIWYKMGLGGLLVYLLFLSKLIYDGFRTGKLLGIYLSTSLIVLSAIHFFTPYLNHPLGLGYLAISAVFIDLLRQQPALAKN